MGNLVKDRLRRIIRRAGYNMNICHWASSRLDRLPKRAPQSGQQRGFTLIELMVGLTLFLILMVGFVPVFAQGLSQSSSARFRSVATNIAREKVEQIRQLDYREIIEDTGHADDPRNLSVRFGNTVTVDEGGRNMTFSIAYQVADEVLPDQAIKSVQVTVTWTAPPGPVSPAVMKTMVAQQYLGPRAAWLELSNTSADTPDPGGTPFPLLATNGALTKVKYHIAESDWFMAYDSLTLPLPSPNNISLESYFRDDAGGEANGIAIANTALQHSTAGSPAAVGDIWFEYSFDARDIPDGYWDLRVTMLNTFAEPGNTWTLRVRVEKGPPDAPTLTATSTSDDTVLLSWVPGTERDRARYVLQRREVNATQTAVMTDWVNVTVSPPYAGLPTNTLPANATSFNDKGTLHASDPLLDVAPCGRPTLKRYYEYRVYGVDTGERSALPDTSKIAFVSLPASEALLKVTVPPVTGLSLASAETALTALGLGWSVTETVDGTVAPGTVLVQTPASGMQVDSGAIVALTVAKAAPPPEVKYTVTISTMNKTARTIAVIDSTNTQVYLGSIVKHANVVISLPNGHYTIHLNSRMGVQLGDFFVNGANCTVSIP